MLPTTRRGIRIQTKYQHSRNRDLALFDTTTGKETGEQRQSDSTNTDATNDLSINDLLSKADAAMYQRKRDGKQGLQFIVDKSDKATLEGMTPQLPQELI